ncbi:MAG TPA: EamA family transporter [Acidimicrobiales bacterium]|nr:EamA family transporter [Acidimicrobiales bacterium]
MVLATVLALAAACLHATWNLILKRVPHEDRDLTSWGLFLFGALLVTPPMIAMGGPGLDVLPWLVLSGLVHMAYITGLVGAYRHGDFSLAYPLARGGGALVAAVGGSILLGDVLSPPAWVAVAVVAGGLLSLVGPGVSRPTVRDALLTAMAIGSYTIIDAHASRLATSGLAYGLATTTAAAVGVSINFLVRGRGPALVAAFPEAWRSWAVAGGCSAVAYALVVVALRYAPVGYVAMLRESSVVLGAAAGWLILKEPLGGKRLVSSLVILLGLLGLVATTL